MEVFVCKDNGGVTGESLLGTKKQQKFLVPSSSGNGIILDKCFAEMGSGESVYRNHLAGTSKGRTVENHLTGKNYIIDMERHVDSMTNVLGNFEDTFMRCENNHEDNTFLSNKHFHHDRMCKSTELNKSEDVDVVDMIECANSSEYGLSETVENDTSDSSFGGTVSDYENGSSFTQFEGNSALTNGKSSAFAFSGCPNDLPLRKKKKVIDHWRTFIHPIEWRCGWVEVQRKKLHLQVFNYERELTQFNRRKKSELGKCTSEEVGAKALPFCGQLQRKNVMKRKKREKIEDTADMKSYMSEHNLFSYFENSKALTGSTRKDNNPSKPVVTPADQNKTAKYEFGVDEEGLTLQFEHHDDSFERIFSRIDSLQFQLQKLKTRGDNLVAELPKKCSSMDTLSLLAPCDALISGPVGFSRERSAVKPDIGSKTNVSNKRKCKRVTAPKTNVSDSKETGELVIPSKTNVITSKRTSGRRKPCSSNWSKRSSGKI